MSTTSWLPNPKLSGRMLTFLEHALKDKVLWDICCDHGYVGIKALHSGQFSKIHFVDKIPHIMERLSTLISQRSKKNTCPYELHVMAGEDINVEVLGTVLIAGVGGLTIKIILDSLIAKNLLFAEKLLLSPHTDEKVLVEYLDSEILKREYTLEEKLMMPEGPRFRPLYILVKN